MARKVRKSGGTADGRTTRALVKRFGIESASGKQSIFGRLATKGYNVYPPIETTSVKEDPRYNGGYTVRHYGDERRGIDAIQFEFGSDLRKRGRTADDFADAIVTFMQDHQLLPTTP